MSPTMSTEVVFLTAVIDGWQNQNVVVIDVPGTFMLDNLVHGRFCIEMVEKLLEINYEMYSPFMVEEKGIQVLSV